MPNILVVWFLAQGAWDLVSRTEWRLLLPRRWWLVHILSGDRGSCCRSILPFFVSRPIGIIVSVSSFRRSLWPLWPNVTLKAFMFILTSTSYKLWSSNPFDMIYRLIIIYRWSDALILKGGSYASRAIISMDILEGVGPRSIPQGTELMDIVWATWLNFSRCTSPYDVDNCSALICNICISLWGRSE